VQSAGEFFMSLKSDRQEKIPTGIFWERFRTGSATGPTTQTRTFSPTEAKNSEIETVGAVFVRRGKRTALLAAATKVASLIDSWVEPEERWSRGRRDNTGGNRGRLDSIYGSGD
jgi:hypothetical protein